MAGKVVLYATDYSAASREALRVATIMARQWDARLVIAHVSEYEQYPVGERFDEQPEASAAQQEELQRVTPPEPGVTCEHRLVYGPSTSGRVDPASEIIKLAAEVGAAAIVIGTHGRSGLSRLLAGSVAESIIHHAPCVVIAVKPASEA